MKTRTEVINLVIPAGQKLASVRQALPVGFILGAEVHCNADTTQNLPTIEIKDDSGASFEKKVHVNHYKRREGGAYLESFKPLNFDTNSKTFQFVAENSVAQNVDTYFSVVLIYRQ